MDPNATLQQVDALAARLACLEYLRAHGYPAAIIATDADFGRPLIVAGGARVEIVASWRKPAGRVAVRVYCQEWPSEHIRNAGHNPDRRVTRKYAREELRHCIPGYHCSAEVAGVPHERLWKRAAGLLEDVTAGLEAWRASIPDQIAAVLAQEAAEHRLEAIAKALGGYARHGEIRGIGRAEADRIAEAMQLDLATKGDT